MPESQIWASDGSHLLHGRGFVDSCKLQINTVLTLARTSRGRAVNTRCRAGGRQPETEPHATALSTRTRSRGKKGRQYSGIPLPKVPQGWMVSRMGTQNKKKAGTGLLDIMTWKSDCSKNYGHPVVAMSTVLETAQSKGKKGILCRKQGGCPLWKS